MNLVYVNNDRPITDSLIVAETFGKRHDRVLQDIRELECSHDFSLLNFVESTYSNERGRDYPKYLITQDGFSFLVMGYTGKEASRFKELYINEFNLMKSQLTIDQLHKNFNLPKSYSEALRLAANYSEENEKVKAENQLLLLENSQKDEQLEKQKPLVSFAETCMVSDKNLLIREVAKLASKNSVLIGQQGLYNKLRSWGMVLKERNEPTQRAMEMGLFEVKQGAFQNPTKTGTYNTITVTPKGQLYIVNRLKEAN